MQPSLATATLRVSGQRYCKIAPQNANHFVPLLRTDDLEDPEPESCASSSVNEDVQSVQSCSSDDADGLKALASMKALAAASASVQEAKDVSDASSSASSVAAQAESSENEEDSSAYDSDATDLFHLEVELRGRLPKIKTVEFPMYWLRRCVDTHSCLLSRATRPPPRASLRWELA